MRSATNNYQESLLDDNADGSQTKADGTLAFDTYLTALTDSSNLTFAPKILDNYTAQSQSLTAGNSITLYTQTNLNNSYIKRVWATAIPPDITSNSGTLAISDLPVIELDYNTNTGEYEKTSSDIFTINGQYTLSYYAQSTDDIISEEIIIRTITVSGASTTNTSGEPTKPSDVVTKPIVRGAPHTLQLPLSETTTGKTCLLLRCRRCQKDRNSTHGTKTKAVKKEIPDCSRP